MRIIQTADLRPDVPLSADHASWVYNGLDCCITAEVYDKLLPQLDNVTTPVYELAKALQGPVLDMNMHGLLIDGHELAEAKATIIGHMGTLDTNLSTVLREGYGRDINWRSPTQLRDFLYDYLLLPKQWKRAANGKRVLTTDRNALEKLQSYLIAAPLVNHMIALRELKKKLEFLESGVSGDGFLRCTYNIAGTKTGRFNSSASVFGEGRNAQNIDRTLRRTVVAAKGKKLANLDLEQADSRNVGANCWNKFYHKHGPEFAGAYLDACESGDLHTTVTQMGWPDLEWADANPRAVADMIAYRDKSYRDLGKVLGHGSNYLGKPFTMAKQSKVPVPMAELFQKRYFSAFPCIPAGHEWTARELRNTASLTTLLGRRRYFFGRLDDEKTLRDAVSYEGQGSTADEANHGMLAVWRSGRKFPGFQLLLQGHDSILFWYDEECEDEIIPWALATMRVDIELAGGRKFVVPTEAKVGWNWGDFNDKAPKAKGDPPLNLDGMKKWKGEDPRSRVQEPRTSYTFK